MRLVLVLGAGATLAQALDARERGHRGELPPLDTTFFDVLNDLPGKVPATLREYAKELLTIDPFAAGAVKPRMEEFFKDAFYDFVQEADHSGPYAKVFGELVVSYRGAIRSTTNWVCEHCDEGPVPDLLAAAATAADHVDVITFNHDLVVENTLAEVSAAKGRWCLRHGYGHFASKRQFTLSKTVDGFDDEETCKHPQPIRIFKLHGSLNWYVESDRPTPDADALRGVRGAAQRIRITRRRQIPSSIRRSGRSSWPVLVPPIYAKQQYIRNFMAPVWRDAHRALAACDGVVFFGYSLPPLDIEAEKDFQRALAQNHRLSHIDVINPDGASASRYAAGFPRLSVHWHSDLGRFLSSDPFARRP